MLKFGSRKKLKEFIHKILSENVETPGYVWTDVGALVGKGGNSECQNANQDSFWAPTEIVNYTKNKLGGQ